MTRLTFLLIFITWTFSTYSQSAADYSAMIKGVWVTPESLLTSEIDEPSNTLYFKYTFDGGGSLFYATNEFERGQFSQYKIFGNKIEMMGYNFTIVSFTDEMLQLETYIERIKTLHTSTLVRKEKYDRLWKLNSNESNETLTLPEFKGNFHLYDYVLSPYNTPVEFEAHRLLMPYQAAPVPPRDDIYLRADLLIDSTGGIVVKDIRSSVKMNEKRVQRIKKKFEKTAGYWNPGKVDNRAVSQSITLTFVTRGKTSMSLKQRSLKHFRAAYNHYQKSDYQAAVVECNNAINLEQSRFQFYIMRAVCHIKLAEVDKYCKDVVAAKSLNPFVSSENVEIVNGEALNIRCGK